MDDLEKQFSDLVYDIAKDMESHGYFCGSEELVGQGQKRLLRDVLQRQLPEAQLPMALYRLTKVIAELTKRKPIVLIDEYYTPISNAFQHGHSPDVCP
jgi:hypothetical protein